MTCSCENICKVLVVDDSRDIGALIRLYSQREPIEVDIAETAEAGLEKFKDSRFDVVLMDFNLPGINGAEAVRRLRQWERQFRKPAVAVFAMTDLMDFASSEKMLGAGCTALIGKPISRGQFLHVACTGRNLLQKAVVHH